MSRRDRRRSETCKREFLHALSFVGLRDEQVTFRVHSEVVRAVELPGPPPRAAKGADDLERLSIEDIDELVRAVVDEQKRLARIAGEPDVPHRTASERLLRDNLFTHERAVFSEHLQ